MSSLHVAAREGIADLVENLVQAGVGVDTPSSDGVTPPTFFFFFFTLVTGPRRSVSLKLSDTRVHEPQLRARSDPELPTLTPKIYNLNRQPHIWGAHHFLRQHL